MKYTIYGGELSYFTRKLEAAMNFYGAEFDLKPKPPEAETRSGTHQVPVLHTPENWMIGDTTPLLQLLDGRYPARRMFPTGSLGVLAHVVEDYIGSRKFSHDWRRFKVNCILKKVCRNTNVYFEFIVLCLLNTIFQFIFEIICSILRIL